MAEPHKKYFIRSDYSLKPIVISENDLRIHTRGLISLDEKSFFNPEVASLADGGEFDMKSIDYVIARYAPPIPKGDWMKAQAYFSLNKISTEDDQVHFVISLPYIEKGQKGIAVSEIEVELYRKPLSIRDFLNKIENTLKSFAQNK